MSGGRPNHWATTEGGPVDATGELAQPRHAPVTRSHNAEVVGLRHGRRATWWCPSLLMYYIDTRPRCLGIAGSVATGEYVPLPKQEGDGFSRASSWADRGFSGGSDLPHTPPFGGVLGRGMRRAVPCPLARLQEPRRRCSCRRPRLMCSFPETNRSPFAMFVAVPGDLSSLFSDRTNAVRGSDAPCAGWDAVRTRGLRDMHPSSRGLMIARILEGSRRHGCCVDRRPRRYLAALSGLPADQARQCLREAGRKVWHR